MQPWRSKTVLADVRPVAVDVRRECDGALLIVSE